MSRPVGASRRWVTGTRTTRCGQASQRCHRGHEQSSCCGTASSSPTGRSHKLLAMTPAAVRAQSAKAIATLGPLDGLREALADPSRTVPSPPRPGGMGSSRESPSPGDAGCRWCRRPPRLASPWPTSSAAARRRPSPLLCSPPPADSDCVLDAAGRRRHRHRSSSRRHERVAVGTRRPVDEVYVVWAGVIGDGRVAVLQGAGRRHSRGGAGQRSGSAGHDRPRPGGLVAAAARRRRWLVVSYDGNTRLTSLTPGRGAQLLSLVLERTSPAPLPCKPNGADWSCATTASRARGCSTAAPTTGA